MNANKCYEYCFIGTLQIDAQTAKNRQWIIEFEKTFL